MEQRSKVLGEEKIGKLLWKFSFPAIIGMLVNALYNVVDSIFVGKGVGDVALTAVGIAFPVSTVLMGFSMLVGIGGAAIVSLRLGQHQKDEAEKILGNAFTLSVIISIALTIIGLLNLDTILTALGANSVILPLARAFTRIILLGAIFQFIGFGLNNIIRAEGNPKVSMATMLISAILNTILNPIFIFGFKIGISGSALATIISQAVSTIWVLSYFTGTKNLLKLKRQNMPLKKNLVLNIFSIGLSPFLLQLAASVVTLLFNKSLLIYGGMISVAALSVINRVSMLILMPIFGINQGAQPIIGYNYGAKQYDRVKSTLKKAIIAATIIVTVGFGLTQIFSHEIIMIFNNNPELVKEGSYGMKILLFMLPVIGFQIVCTNYFQAVGKAKYSIFLSLLRQVIVLIPLVLILPKHFGLKGVWLAGPVSDLSATITTGILMFFEIKKLKRLQKEKQLES